MKYLLCLLCVAFLSGGCLKKDTGCNYSQSNIVAPVSEQQQVEQYLAANGITATKHSSGLYYQVINMGSGGSPDLCSQVSLSYSGKLTDGTQFDASSGVVFQLGSLIEGWKKGVPLIQKGGTIKLYVPPSLGYGPQPFRDQQGNIVIPGNSVLIFDVTIIDF